MIRLRYAYTYCDHYPLCAGNPGVRVRAEGAAAAAAEAHDPAAPARGHAHPGAVALLRVRRALHEHRHLEDTPDPAAQPADQVWHSMSV